MLDPDMPVQEPRLHMGELTPDEVLVARAAIRWANSALESRPRGAVATTKEEDYGTIYRN